MARTIEFTLGLIGGILGFIGSLIALAIGGLMGAGSTNVHGVTFTGSNLMLLGWLAMFFSILGIVGASKVNNKPKTAGTLMIISAIGGVICISFYYALSFVLLLIAGIMARKEDGEEISKKKIKRKK